MKPAKNPSPQAQPDQPSAHNKREAERIRTAHYLRVYDDRTDAYLGHVYDISPTGMRLIGDRQFITDSTLRIKIRLPEEGILGESIVIDAQNRWCSFNEPIGLFESGFQFVEKAGVAVFSVRTLIGDILQRPVE